MLDNMLLTPVAGSLQPTHKISLAGDAWLVEQSWSEVVPTQEMQDITALLGVMPQAPNHTQAMVLAQQFDQDILGDLGKAVRNFIDSGQIWALLVGVVLGYLIRGLTSY